MTSISQPITIATATPALNFIGATRAFIRINLPKAYHRTEEFEYKCETDGHTPISLMVWKRNTERNTTPRVINVEGYFKTCLAAIIKELTSNITDDMD